MITILAALALSGPNFTETVNETDDKFVLNYVSHDSGNITLPLELWFNFSGNPSNLSGELSHKSVSYSLFDNYTPTTSTVFIAPIDQFFGEKINGNWQLKINSDSPFELQEWGVRTIVPEPSTFSLLFLGSLLYLIRNKKP